MAHMLKELSDCTLRERRIFLSRKRIPHTVTEPVREGGHENPIPKPICTPIPRSLQTREWMSPDTLTSGEWDKISMEYAKSGSRPENPFARAIGEIQEEEEDPLDKSQEDLDLHRMFQKAKGKHPKQKDDIFRQWDHSVQETAIEGREKSVAKAKKLRSEVLDLVNKLSFVLVGFIDFMSDNQVILEMLVDMGKTIKTQILKLDWNSEALCRFIPFLELVNLRNFAQNQTKCEKTEVLGGKFIDQFIQEAVCLECLLKQLSELKEAEFPELAFTVALRKIKVNEIEKIFSEIKIEQLRQQDKTDFIRSQHLPRMHKQGKQIMQEIDNSVEEKEDDEMDTEAEAIILRVLIAQTKLAILLSDFVTLVLNNKTVLEKIIILADTVVAQIRQPDGRSVASQGFLPFLRKIEQQKKDTGELGFVQKLMKDEMIALGKKFMDKFVHKAECLGYLFSHMNNLRGSDWAELEPAVGQFEEQVDEMQKSFSELKEVKERSTTAEEDEIGY